MIPCKRCLLAELSQTDYTKTLLEYIASVPMERRVDEKTYAARLEACRSCDELTDGMCMQCGCYAELRALKPEQECAAADKRWHRS
ncbi:MAG: hypothetical protein IKP47_05460 [Ruminococcus sp.]|nr:hypothetical protein [Ruminococcus sp.]